MTAEQLDLIGDDILNGGIEAGTPTGAVLSETNMPQAQRSSSDHEIGTSSNKDRNRPPSETDTATNASDQESAPATAPVSPARASSVSDADKKPRTPPGPSKRDAVLKLLRRKRGASLADLMEATGWQAHSVRGFLSGTVKTKLALTLIAEKGKDGVLRYRIGEA